MRVLIAIEDEQFAPRILDFVLRHSWEPGSMLRLITVVEPSVVGDNVTAVYGGGIDHQILEERINKGSSLLNRYRDELQSKIGNAIPVEVTVIVGRPHHVILQVADEWKADMIVMGSHGRAGFSRFLLGSVSLAVVSHAPCGVTIVRPASTTDDQSTEARQEKLARAAG